MSYNNRITLTGNLTRDPEYKTISAGGQDRELVSFRMAVNENYGNGKEKTVYLDVDLWGPGHTKYAQAVQLSKGVPVHVDGSLEQRNWEDSNGGKRTNYTVSPRKFSKLMKPGRSEESQSF